MSYTPVTYVPPAVGDVLFLHCRTETSDGAPSLTAEGFTELDVTGDNNRWDVTWFRVADGSETGEVRVENLDALAFSQVQLLHVTGCDPADAAVAGAGEAFDGFWSSNQVIDVDAVTTTVDSSLVLIGFTTYTWFLEGSDGATVTSGTVDGRAVLDDHESVSVWYMDAGPAGTAGPWQIDRDGEDSTAGSLIGGSWWTVVLQPVATDPVPVIAAVYTNTLWPVDPPPPPPTPITLTGPNGETVVIGGETPTEQADLIEAQEELWAAQTAVPDLIALIPVWLEGWDTEDVSGETDVVQALVAQWVEALPALKIIAERGLAG